MKEQIETAVPRSKFVASDSDEARKTATGHSCKTLWPIPKSMKTRFLIVLICILLAFMATGQNKKLILTIEDTLMYNSYKFFQMHHKLPDLSKSTDSIYVRIKESSLINFNHIYEFKYTNGIWNGRIIAYGAADYYRFFTSFVLFNKLHSFSSKKTKNLDILYQKNINPSYSDSEISWDSIAHDIIKLGEIRTQVIADTSESSVNDGVWYDIEFATPKTVKYVYWANPKYASISEDSNAVLKMETLIGEIIIPESKSRWKQIKKTNWP